ncbi:MAG: MFS transporter [Bacteroidetes bacterium]|nr:MFS transporter [Bacteroidota bacterium]
MESGNKNKPSVSQKDKIHFGQLAAYGAGGIIPVALFNIAGILVGLMGNISLGLSAFWLGLILIVPRLWDSFSDPIIGHFSDNTRTRWGRRRPFLLFGGILSALFFVVIWLIPKGETVQQWFPTESGYQVFQLLYILISLLLFFTAVNLFEIPHGALGMEMTSDPHERTRLFSAKSFVGNLFAMSTPWLFWLANLKIFKGAGGNEMDGMRYVSLMIAGLLIPLSFWWFFKLREPRFQASKPQEKTDFWKDMRMVISNRNFVFLTLTIFTLAMGFNFVQLLGSYIPIFYVFGGDKLAGATMLGINGTVWAITGVLAVFPLNWISPKLGKRKTLMIAMLLMIAAQLSKIVCYNPKYPYLIVIPTVLLSAGMLFFFTLGSSMVGDICDEDELKTGKRTEGSYYAVFWWFIKLGSALASFVAGALIVVTMFDETQVTKVDKFQGNMDEIASWVKNWDNSIKENKLNPQALQTLQNDALSEAKAYQKLLNKEHDKKFENTFKNIPEYTAQRDSLISANLVSVEKSISYLSANKLAADSVMKNKEYIPSALVQTKLDKLSSSTLELQAYLKDKSFNKKAKNKDHYQLLANEMQIVQDSLSVVENNISLPVLQSYLKSMGTEIISLKRQTPYTLLMMRIVEIGLPVLLSIISLLLIFRYTLTEKRSLEIKELLKAKNANAGA